MSLSQVYFVGCILSLVAVAGGAQPNSQKTVTVMAFNIENVFDVDSVSLYADVPVQGNSPIVWTPEKLARKLGTVSQVIRQATPDGKGPDILVIDELEADHTPESSITPAEFLAAHQGKSYRELLKGKLPPELAGAPSEAWLLKALEDEGLTGYKLVTGDVRDIKTEAIHCGVLTRLPIRSTRQLPVDEARTIVEVEVEVAGSSVHIFANHWKSGAGDAALELIRIGNAQVLRTRIDEILKLNPDAAIVVAGDLNSHYNQAQRYPYMPRTAVQDVLRSQGDPAKLTKGSADLYNLWFDVAPELRGSDTYRGEWGTLMQIIISRSLADGKGVDYVGGSFRTVGLPGINTRGDTGLPWSWTSYGPGAGCSDHLPVIATFRMIPEGEVAQSPLKRPEVAPSDALSCYPQPINREQLRSAATIAHLGPDAIANAIGDIFRVEGTFVGGSKPAVRVGEVEYPLYASDRNLLTAIKSMEKGTKLNWVAKLEFHKERLEFVIERPEWIKPSSGR